LRPIYFGFRHFFDAMDDDLARMGQWPSFICIALSAGDASKVEAVSRSCIQDFVAANTDVLCGHKRRRDDDGEDGDGEEPTPPSSSSSSSTLPFVATERARLHVSLSKLFLLRHHQILPFVQRLGQLMAPVFRTPLSVSVGCDHVAVLPNEEKTRSYVALTIGDHHHDGALLKLVAACNEALQAFNAPTYHDAPVFHVSAGYFPYNDKLQAGAGAAAAAGGAYEAPAGAARDAVDRFCSFADDGSSDDDDEEDETSVPRTLRAAVVKLRTVECRIGNRLFRLTAPSGPTASAAREFVEVAE